jgi:hypothetical protein
LSNAQFHTGLCLAMTRERGEINHQLVITCNLRFERNACGENICLPGCRQETAVVEMRDTNGPAVQSDPRAWGGGGVPLTPPLLLMQEVADVSGV